MAERYDFYVHDNREITFNLTEPIMREDSGVTDFVFHIPKVLNELEVSDWQWWLVFVNAKKEKYSIALTLSDDPERPLEFNTATYTVDYAMSIKAGAVQFALEAINAGTGGAIDNEWHTLTYETKVKETLQGNQAEFAETESDIISALIVEVQNKVNSLVGGATPRVVSSVSDMTDTSKIYVLSTDGNWYWYNGSAWVSGGQYASGITIDPTLTQSGQAADAKVVGDKIIDLKADLNQAIEDFAVPTQEAVDNWLDEHPEATTTVQDGSVTEAKLAQALTDAIKFNVDQIKLVVVDCHNRASCNAFIQPDGRFFLVDFGDSQSAQYVIDAVDQNGGTVFCGAILTHAHFDHVGDYQTITEHYELGENFVLYAPTRPDTTVETITDIIQDYDDITAYFGTVGRVVIPDANTKYTICDLPIVFYNTDSSYYYTLGANYRYNDTSLCGCVSVGDTNISFWGDVYTLAQRRIVSLEHPTQSEIMIAPHHGVSSNASRDFLDTIQPKCLIGNVGSASNITGTLSYNSPFMSYSENAFCPIYDTESGDVVLDVFQNKTYKINRLPIFYPAYIANYASLRDNTNLSIGYNDTDSIVSSTGIKDAILSMRINSSVTCFITDNYQIARDLGISSVLNFLKITKFTGGSTNNLYDRQYSDRFLFTIEITPIYDYSLKQTIYGRYSNSTWSTFKDYANMVDAFDLNTAGVVTLKMQNGFLVSSANNKITLPMSGYYEVVVSNNTSGNTTFAFGTASITVSANATNTMFLTRTAGEYNISTDYHSVSVIVRFLRRIEIANFPTA